VDQPHPSALPLPMPHHLGGRHQSLPLRLVGRPGAPLPLWRSGTAALLGSALRAIARPNRSAGGDEPLRPPRPGGGLPAGQQTNGDAGPGPWGSRGEPLSGRAGSGGKATLSRPQPRRLRQRGTAFSSMLRPWRSGSRPSASGIFQRDREHGCCAWPARSAIWSSRSGWGRRRWLRPSPTAASMGWGWARRPSSAGAAPRPDAVGPYNHQGGGDGPLPPRVCRRRD
jgi:hypothetical protein